MAERHDTGLAPGDFEDGERRLVDTPRGRYAVVRREGAGGLFADPTFVAFEAWCPHIDGPLWEGSLVGDEIGCPWHAWRYSLTTGRCTWAPEGDAEEAAETELGRAACAPGPGGTLWLTFEDGESEPRTDANGSHGPD